MLPLYTGRHQRRSLLWQYAATGLFFDVLILVLKGVLHLSYQWTGNLFVLVEFALFTFIYREVAHLPRTLLLTAAGCAAAFFIGHTAISGAIVFNTVGASLFYCFYILYALTGFRHLLRAPTEQYVTRLPAFWLYVGILIYSAGCILIFLSKDFLRGTDDVFFLFLWSTVFRLLNITKNSFLAIALSKTAAVK